MSTASRKIPYTNSRKHWLLGEAKELREGMLPWMTRSTADVGDTYQAKVPGHSLIVTTRPEYIRHFLLDNHKNYQKSMGYQILKLFLGQGLLTSEGDLWLRQRRLAQPAFHRKRLAAIADTMTEESALVAKSWVKKKAAGDAVDILSEMMEATMRIVARSLFSADVSKDIEIISHNLEQLNQFAIHRIVAPIKLPIWIPTRRSREFRVCRDAIDEVIYRIIESRRGKTQEHDDLLSMLMEAKDEDTGESMNDQQLRDESITIFVAGHETTAVAMTWTWVMISKHPEVLEKLRAEAKEVLGGRAAKIGDMANLPYTRQVIDEVLRLYPPAWVVGRKAQMEDKLDEYVVPKGANVLMVTYLTHRRPDLYPDPEAFQPERWTDEFKKQLPKFAYLLFGGGPRLCIGNNFALMEMVILLATLVQDYYPKLEGNTPEMDPLITLRPKGDVNMKIT